MAWSFCCRAKERLWKKIRTARIDRRQFVPLLAQTIPGVEYRDGRNKVVSSHWQENTPGLVKLDVGIRPYDITTDGRFIWFTDTFSADQSVLKMRRDAGAVEKISLGQKSWGIAFDGEFMWVTHPEADAVSRIATKPKHGHKPERLINIKKDAADPDKRLLPKEIIFAQDWVWIARQGGVTRVHARTCQREHFDLGFTPLAMAFDGTFIWLLHHGEDKSGRIRKINLQGRESSVQGSIMVGANPANLVFDGTHIWATHNDGVTQIDIDEHEEEKTVSSDQAFTGAAFDGMHLWVAEPAGKRVHKIDILGQEPVGDFRPLENFFPKEDERPEEQRHFARLCFDGIYLWLTDCIGATEQTGQGLIYRFLV